MSAIRKIERTMMKSHLGTNDISESWRDKQVVKYGVEGYIAIRNKNRKVVKMSPKRSHHVGPKFVLTDKTGITEIQTND